MLKNVDKMWRRLWMAMRKNSGKFCTFLTFLINHCEMLWRMFGFTQSFGWIYTNISTESLFGFMGVEGVDLHIYT